MQRISLHRARRAAFLPLLAALAACGGGVDQMEWARTALERNQRLEIVATDEEARTFTVRDRDSGELKVVSVDEISAAPPVTTPRLASATPGAAAAQAAPPAGTGEDAAPIEREPAQPVDENDPAARVGDEVIEPVQATNEGRVIASGPGYSIKSAGANAASPTASTAAAAPAAAASERRYEPLVCQGSRFLRIDGRSISFEGDGVKAEDGCEIYITNSQITANGVGVAARGANVHIKNSTVAGESGAIHASGNAQIYAQSSRFRGMVRKLDTAVLHDGGDNVWN